jgi:3-dehydroquinate synthase
VLHVLDVSPPAAPPYPVLAGDDAAAAIVSRWDARWRLAVVIGDETTSPRFGAPIAAALEAAGTPALCLAFPAGEGHKTRASKEALEDAMLAAGVDRQCCVVAVGGGVPLDVAGYVAATYLRGVPHLNVATTLLAQVDAAIGGKTGVNTPAGKNLIGALHHPRAVLLDMAALAMLPATELKNGLAESVKHAVLADAAHFADLEAWARAREGLRPADAVIARSVAIKAAVVAADDRDGGRRDILNYGHTVAHAVEHATQHAIAHGHAVAIGMVVEARVAAAAGTFPEADLARLIALLTALELPTAPPCPFEAVEPYLARDKKAERGAIRCAIPRCIGDTPAEPDGRYTRVVQPEALRSAWR